MHDGKKGSTLKQELKEVFKELECGALECLTCGFAVSATELVERMEKDSGVGIVGVLSSHPQSSQHKAAVAMLKKANEPPKKGPLNDFFPTVALQRQQQTAAATTAAAPQAGCWAWTPPRSPACAAPATLPAWRGPHC